MHVHGVAGIGKSSLLEAFAARARAQGAAVVRLDCRAIEPTERGFLRELGAAIGGDPPTAEEAATRLGGLAARVVLALDTYELLRVLDTWLRQAFVPALGDNVRVLVFGREAPAAAWFAAPGWQALVRALPLGPLAERDALELLVRAGVGQDDAGRINRFARGHPLALRLAAAAAAERPELDLEEAVAPRVVEELTRLYLAGIDDPITRRALDAAAVVRRTTLSLLQAMVPEGAPQDAYERLRVLPFVEAGRDGLHLHDAVQQAVAADLRAADPAKYRNYRRATWRQLRSEVRTAGRAELWRYTADMLYLLENPLVREAFFPSGAHGVVVEPALPDDGPPIRAIAARHDGAESLACVDASWRHAPHAFSVSRGRGGVVTGFYCMFEPIAVSPALLRDDPLLSRWCDHLRRDPVPKHQRVLFSRRLLGLEHGEAPSAEQGAFFLDIKRTYMELRPHLRRIYWTLRDLPTYAPFLQRLGFRTLPEAAVQLDGATYHTVMNDFGPSSVDGWLAGLVAAELGVEEDDLLDPEARALVADGRRVGLTRLEFAVMQYLVQREGKAVARQSLLADVWGYDYVGGSNVVDVVVRSLRKKLGDRAASLETVTGIGYRLRRE